MKNSISIQQLKTYYENDDLSALYYAILEIYSENTNGSELGEPLKKEIQYTLLFATDFDTILERLQGLIDTYQHQHPSMSSWE